MQQASLKATHYREQAANLRRMAAGAPESSKARNQLLDLARQYDRLAVSVEGHSDPG